MLDRLPELQLLLVDVILRLRGHNVRGGQLLGFFKLHHAVRPPLAPRIHNGAARRAPLRPAPGTLLLLLPGAGAALGAPSGHGLNKKNWISRFLMEEEQIVRLVLHHLCVVEFDFEEDKKTLEEQWAIKVGVLSEEASAGVSGHARHRTIEREKDWFLGEKLVEQSQKWQWPVSGVSTMLLTKVFSTYTIASNTALTARICISLKFRISYI